VHYTERHHKLAESIEKMNPGDSLKQVLMGAGYSEQNANHGWSAVPNRVVKLLSRKGLRLKALGEIDADTQEKLTRGRLVYNVIKGSDKGVLSAKALGSDRRVNMFQAELQAGVIVISLPSQIAEHKDKLLETPEE
jgi:hypothetical protein